MRYFPVLLAVIFLSACAPVRLSRSSLPIVPQSNPKNDAGKLHDRAHDASDLHKDTDEGHEPESDDDERHNPINNVRQVSLDSARALAAVRSVTSLGDWRSIGPSIYAGKAFDVAVSPVDPNTVYAAYGVGGGLWKTADGGQTWLQLTDRSDLTSIACVTVHPYIPNVVVSCVGGPGHPSPSRGLLYSTDAGRHFDLIGPSDGLSTSFYRAIFNPDDPNIIYAASEIGVYLTKNRGVTWNLILTFPGSNPDDYDHLPDLVMKPDDPAVLIAAQASLGIVRTSDGGATWAHVDQTIGPAVQISGEPLPTTVLAWSPSDPNAAYCERNNPDGQHMLTYASTDAGQTWSQAANLAFYHQDRYDMALAVDPTNPSRVMLANGYFGTSTDGLRTYSGYNSYPHADHLRVVFAPSKPTIVYDANDGGIWRSTDSGATWSRFDVGVNTNLSFGFDIDTASGQIYLSPGDYGSLQYTPADGWYSSPHGGEWSKFYIDPNDSTAVWHAAAPGTSDLAVSHDRGQTWTEADPDPGAPRPYRTVLRFDPTQSGTLFFLTNKVWVSHNAGTTWKDLGIRGSDGGVLTDMIFDLAQPGAAYVSEDGGVFSTSNDGVTWTEHKSYTGGMPYNNRIMAPIPGAPGKFYMSSEGGIYLLFNGGQQAQLLPGSLFQDVSINDLATDPAHPERVYAGTAAGLFFSQDYGQSWQRLGRNLPATNVWQISVKGTTIFAGTSQGIWQFSSDVSWQPTPPAKFAVAGTSTSSITLSWMSGNGSTGVRIFRNGVQAYVGLENSYTDLDLTPATNFCYTALDSNASGDGPLSAPLCVNTAAVSDASPSLSVSPTSLQIVYTLGSRLPGGLPIQIANGGGGTLSWTASSSTPWLTVNPTSGGAPATLAVEVNSAAESFAAATYTGSVSITIPGLTSQTSQTVSVTLKVNPTPIVITDLGSNDGFSLNNGWCVTGATNSDCGPEVTRYVAAPFVPSSTFTLSKITLAIKYSSGQNGAVINLMSTSGALPGAVLESWSVSNLPSAPLMTSVSSKLNPVLQAGQTYWVEAEPLAPNTLNFWYANNLGLAGGMTNVNQAGWTSLPGPNLPAFSVTGFSIPTINPGGVVPLFSSVNTIQPGSWVSIYGFNLVSASAAWNGSFQDSISLGGVSVTIDGHPAYISAMTKGTAANPDQINLEAPDDTATGPVPVVVTNTLGTVSSTVTLAPVAPSFSLLDNKHVAGIILTPNGTGAYGNGAYDIVGPVSAFAYAARPVKAGETLVLYGVGFGPTNPTVPAGVLFSGAARAAKQITMTIGGVPVPISFAGISYTGQFQFNLVMPSAPSGDQPIIATVDGVQSPGNFVITVQ